MLDIIENIASDTSIPSHVQRNGHIVKEKMIDGISVKVVTEPHSRGGEVVTGYCYEYAKE